MVAYVHEQRLRQIMRGWDELQTNFIGSEGYGVITDQITQRGQREFNRRVYLEVERRRQGITGGEDNQLILSAVTKWEQVMDELRVTQKKARTAGHNRLADTSVGYAPRKLLVSAVKKMEREDQTGYNAVLGVLARQLIDPALDNRFDEKFAKRLAKEYLERAIHRWAGEGEIPIMLHEPDASQTLRDALKGMGDVTPEELDKFMGRYSRGGGEWTKKRLDLNLLEELPPGPDGRPRLLADLFDQDMYALFSNQARRVLGRHDALAQAQAIFGKPKQSSLSTSQKRQSRA